MATTLSIRKKQCGFIDTGIEIVRPPNVNLTISLIKIPNLSISDSATTRTARNLVFVREYGIFSV